MALIREHAKVGEELMSKVDFPWPIAQVVGQHHERLDGSGYPRGLRGSEILLPARVIAVADVVEAMANARPYRLGLGVEKAIDQIRAGRGVTFDADAVDACVAGIEEGFDLKGGIDFSAPDASVFP